jgi:hypothetical protein
MPKTLWFDFFQRDSLNESNETKSIQWQGTKPPAGSSYFNRGCSTSFSIFIGCPQCSEFLAPHSSTDSALDMFHHVFVSRVEMRNQPLTICFPQSPNQSRAGCFQPRSLNDYLTNQPTNQPTNQSHLSKNQLRSSYGRSPFRKFETKNSIPTKSAASVQQYKGPGHERS